jgi:hypothetical protein
MASPVAVVAPMMYVPQPKLAPLPDTHTLDVNYPARLDAKAGWCKLTSVLTAPDCSASN